LGSYPKLRTKYKECLRAVCPGEYLDYENGSDANIEKMAQY